MGCTPSKQPSDDKKKIAEPANAETAASKSGNIVNPGNKDNEKAGKIEDTKQIDKPPEKKDQTEVNSSPKPPEKKIEPNPPEPKPEFIPEKLQENHKEPAENKPVISVLPPSPSPAPATEEEKKMETVDEVVEKGGKRVEDDESPEGLDKELLEEQNNARTNPSEYSKKIEKFLPYFKGTVLEMPGEIKLRTQEGEKAYKEAISFLKKQGPLPAMKWSKGLAKAAKDHAEDMKISGITGHTGSDGSSSTTRIERYGEWNGGIGENICYGSTTAERIIIQLIVDDGVQSRGHRMNIFSKFLVCGIAHAEHPTFRLSAVFDFANSFVEGGKVKDKVEAAPIIKSEPQDLISPAPGSAAKGGDPVIGETCSEVIQTAGGKKTKIKTIVKTYKSGRKETFTEKTTFN